MAITKSAKIEAEIEKVKACLLYTSPPDLVTFSKDAAELLADLQSRNERMFLLTFLIVNTAPTRERLDNDIFTVNGIAQKYNCVVKRLSLIHI